MLNSLDAPMRPTTINDNVATAAAVLDQVKPGWAHRVNTGILDLSSGHHCVLGQAFRGKERTVEHGGYYLSAYHTGFDALARACPGELINRAVFADNVRYRADWIAAIEARQRVTVAA